MQNCKKGQIDVFNIFIGGSITLLVLGFVLLLSIITLAQTYSTLASQDTSTTGASDELFNATASTAKSLNHVIVGVSSFSSALVNISYSDTWVTGNNTSSVNLPANYISSPNYTTLAYNLTVTASLLNESVQTIMVDSCNGNRTLADGVNTFVNYGAICLTNPLTISFVSNSTMFPNTSIITNVSVRMFSWVSNLNYTVNSAGAIVPINSGVAKISYSYPNDGGTGMNTTSAKTAIQQTQNAISQFPQWLTLVVLALVIVGLLGLILGIIVFVRNTGLMGGGGVQ